MVGSDSVSRYPSSPRSAAAARAALDGVGGQPVELGPVGDVHREVVGLGEQLAPNSVVSEEICALSSRRRPASASSAPRRRGRSHGGSARAPGPARRRARASLARRARRSMRANSRGSSRMASLCAASARRQLGLQRPHLVGDRSSAARLQNTRVTRCSRAPERSSASTVFAKVGSAGLGRRSPRPPGRCSATGRRRRGGSARAGSRRTAGGRRAGRSATAKGSSRQGESGVRRVEVPRRQPPAFPSPGPSGEGCPPGRDRAFRDGRRHNSSDWALAQPPKDGAEYGKVAQSLRDNCGHCCAWSSVKGFHHAWTVVVEGRPNPDAVPSRRQSPWGFASTSRDRVVGLTAVRLFLAACGGS